MYCLRKIKNKYLILYFKYVKFKWVILNCILRIVVIRYNKLFFFYF